MKRIVLQKAVEALNKGGKIILDVFEKEQIKNNSGGPKEEALLYSLEDIVENLIDLEVEKFSKENIDLSEGEYHKWKAAVIRFIGTKNRQSNPHLS